MDEYTGAVKPPVREIGNCDSGRLETDMPIEKLVKALYFLNLWLDRIGRRHHGH